MKVAWSIEEVGGLVDAAMRDITDCVGLIDPNRGWNLKARELEGKEKQVVEKLEDACTLLHEVEALILEDLVEEKS